MPHLVWGWIHNEYAPSWYNPLARNSERKPYLCLSSTPSLTDATISSTKRRHADYFRRSSILKFCLQFWSTSPTQTPQLQQNTQPWLGAAGCWIRCVSKGAKRWGGSYLVVVQSIISSIATTWSNISDQKSKSRQTSNKCWCEAPLTDHNTYSITWFILL